MEDNDVDKWFSDFWESIKDDGPKLLIDHKRVEKMKPIVGDIYVKLGNELGLNIPKIHSFILHIIVLQEMRFRIQSYYQRANQKYKPGSKEFLDTFNKLFDENFEKDMKYLISFAKAFEFMEK